MGKKIIPPDDPERLARVTNDRVRRIGVDLQGLDLQVRDKRAAAAEAAQKQRESEAADLALAASLGNAARLADLTQCEASQNLAHIWKAEIDRAHEESREHAQQAENEKLREVAAAVESPFLTERVVARSPMDFKGFSTDKRQNFWKACEDQVKAHREEGNARAVADKAQDMVIRAIEASLASRQSQEMLRQREQQAALKSIWKEQEKEETMSIPSWQTLLAVPSGLRGTFDVSAAMQAGATRRAEESLTGIRRLQNTSRDLDDEYMAAAPEVATESEEVVSISSLSTSASSIPTSYTPDFQDAPSPFDRLSQPTSPSRDFIAPLSRFRPSTVYGACPTGWSVRNYGGSGDNTTNNVNAINLATKHLPALYFPREPGQSQTSYLIANSMTITLPIIVDCGVTISVIRGKRLLISAQPRATCMQQPIFDGGGSIVMDGTVQEVYPSWWGRSGQDDSAAMQAAVDACTANGCAVVLARSMGLRRPVYFRGRGAGAFATAAGILYPIGNDASNIANYHAIKLNGGVYREPLVFADVIAFRYAIQVGGSVQNANVFLGTATYGVTAVRIAPPLNSAIQNTEIFAVACAFYDNCVEYMGVSATPGSRFVPTIRETTVRINFLVNVRYTAAKFLGPTAPKFENSGVIFQAVDPNGVRASFSTLRNYAANSVQDFAFSVDTWAGGYSMSADQYGDLSPGQLVQGRFTNLLASFRCATPDQMPSNNIFSLPGSKNVASLPFLASAGVLYPASSNMPASIGNEPVFYTSITTNSDWKAGTRRIFHVWSPMARWMPVTSDGFSFVPFRQYNPGLVVRSIVNQNSQAKNRIEIVVENVSPYPIAPLTFRFGIQTSW